MVNEYKLNRKGVTFNRRIECQLEANSGKRSKFIKSPSLHMGHFNCGSLYDTNPPLGREQMLSGTYVRYFLPHSIHKAMMASVHSMKQLV